MSEIDAENRIGRWVRWARLERGWSQRELAERLAPLGFKVDPSAITRLEKGRRPIRVDEAVAIANVFGVSMETMLSPVNFYSKAAYALVALHAATDNAEDKRSRAIEALLELDEDDIEEESADEHLEAARQQVLQLIQWMRDYDQMVFERRIVQLEEMVKDRLIDPLDQKRPIVIDLLGAPSGQVILRLSFIDENSNKHVDYGPCSMGTALGIFLAVARSWDASVVLAGARSGVPRNSEFVDKRK